MLANYLSGSSLIKVTSPSGPVNTNVATCYKNYNYINLLTVASYVWFVITCTTVLMVCQLCALLFCKTVMTSGLSILSFKM